MRKFLLLGLIIITLTGILVVILGQLQKKKTKSFSPEDQVSFTDKDLQIKVLYNRPYKKGRKIFGGLVPYNEVWRTGANEATTFENNKDIIFEGKTLKKGKYSLWTIPRQDVWTIIFNSEYGQWGINSKGEANRSPERDVLTFDVAAIEQKQVFEQFTIAFEKTGEEAEMVLLWDTTLVAIPFSY